MKMQPKASEHYYYSQTRFLFHCHIKIKLSIVYPEDLIDQSFSLLEQIDRRYNSYRPNSFFDQINRFHGQWVEVDQLSMDWLKKVLAVCELTDGAFDITAMPLLKLWGFYRSDNLHVPNKNELKNSLEKVDYRKVELSDNQVRIGVDQEINTGPFMKAAALDQLLKWWKKIGIHDALINAGGSTITGLTDNGQAGWGINLPDPLKKGKKLGRIELSNSCFSMSATQEHFVEIDGKRYGHILNAKTGYPVRTLQTGIRTQSALDSDLLATALFSSDEDFDKLYKKLNRICSFDAYRMNGEGMIEKQGFNF